MVGALLRAAVAAALFLGPAAPADSRNGAGALSARPGAAATTAFSVGLSRLPHDALFYRPASAPAGPAPLLVLLHGAGGNSAAFLSRFRATADRSGVMLLALQSQGPTWDLVPERKRGSGPVSIPRSQRLRFGRDAARIDEVLTELFAGAAVDPRRLVLLGFSDGASYALALGLANPRLFRSIVALSPGFLVEPRSVDRSQRIFVAHATDDPVLPFETTERDIVGKLRDAQLRPRFRAHDGGHRIDDRALDEGLAFALAPPGS